MQMTRSEKLAKFGEGPWLDEPDRELWKSEGFDCLINRNHVGSWCGYVGLKKGHPYFEKSYNDIYKNGDGIDVHGGLTYSDHCHGAICHPSDDGDHVWWLGFDCGHAFDFSPGLGRSLAEAYTNEVYKDQAYVKAEVESLARQLRALEVKA